MYIVKKKLFICLRLKNDSLPCKQKHKQTKCDYGIAIQSCWEIFCFDMWDNEKQLYHTHQQKMSTQESNVLISTRLRFTFSMTIHAKSLYLAATESFNICFQLLSSLVLWFYFYFYFVLKITSKTKLQCKL